MQENKRERRLCRGSGLQSTEFNRLLDLLLYLDRTLVEISMRLYGVPEQHQLAMRAQNQRLHDAVRRRMPSVMSRRVLLPRRPVVERKTAQR
jgi:signal recognition particle GTPase